MCHVDSPADGRSHVTTIRKGVSENNFQHYQNDDWRKHSEDTVLADVTDIGRSAFHRCDLLNFTG
jgi:hypothetical protein